MRYSEAWEPPEGADRVATFAVDIMGVPARATGSLCLISQGESTALSIKGSVTTHVPFLAGLVTKAIMDSLHDAISKEIEAADSWLGA